MFVNVNCAVCDSPRNSLFLKKERSGVTFNLVQCAECGLVYVNPRLEDSRYHDVYEGDWYPNFDFNQHIKEIEETKEFYKERYERRLSDVERFVRGGRILDVGCQLGFFLDIARRRGWQTFGVEMATKSVQYGRTVLGLAVSQGQLTDTSFENNFFDAVSLQHVLEHVPNIHEFLAELHRILRPGGCLLVEVPNIESREFQKYGVQWGIIKPEQHLYYFSRHTLSKILNRFGFKIVFAGLDGSYRFGRVIKGARLGGLLPIFSSLYPVLKRVKRILVGAGSFLIPPDQHIVIVSLKE